MPLCTSPPRDSLLPAGVGVTEGRLWREGSWERRLSRGARVRGERARPVPVGAQACVHGERWSRTSGVKCHQSARTRRYVVDSADPDSIPASKAELHELLAKPALEARAHGDHAAVIRLPRAIDRVD